MSALGGHDLIVSKDLEDKISFDERGQNVVTVTLEVTVDKESSFLVGAMRGYRRSRDGIDVEVECNLDAAFRFGTSPLHQLAVDKLILSIGSSVDVEIPIDDMSLAELLLADVNVDQGTCILGVKLTSD